MEIFCFVGVRWLLYLTSLAQAATIPTPITLNSALSSTPFNLSAPRNANTGPSAPPLVPFAYEIPYTSMVLLFTSFDALLPSTDVLSNIIDATLLAIDGMSNDAHQSIPPSQSLRWQQGAVELSILPLHLMSYNMLAITLAGVQAVELEFGSIRNGMYATRFEIFVSNTKVGSGKLASKATNPGRQSQLSSLSDNSTATARRTLTLPPDPFKMRVGNTPIHIFLSSYRSVLPLADQLCLLVEIMFSAATSIRDSRRDVLIYRSWVWRGAVVQMNLYPRTNMSWRNLATAAKGMKDFLVEQGRGLDFKFEVEMDLIGSLGLGRLGRIGLG